jgi:transposase
MRMATAAPAGFAPVHVVSEAATAALAGSGTIEIEFAAGSRLRIMGAVDPATLTAAIAAR